MNNEKNEMTFDDIYNIGYFYDDVKIGSHIFRLKTLSFGEVNSIKEGSNLDILAYSIESIDGKEISMDQKVSILNKLQAPVVVILMKAYEALVKKQDSFIEEVKKK